MTSNLTLVTGAGGSIGAHIVRDLLAADRPVRVSSRNPKPGQFPSVACSPGPPGSVSGPRWRRSGPTSR